MLMLSSVMNFNILASFPKWKAFLMVKPQGHMGLTPLTQPGSRANPITSLPGYVGKPKMGVQFLPQQLMLKW